MIGQGRSRENGGLARDSKAAGDWSGVPASQTNPSLRWVLQLRGGRTRLVFSCGTWLWGSFVCWEWGVDDGRMDRRMDGDRQTDPTAPLRNSSGALAVPAALSLTLHHLKPSRRSFCPALTEQTQRLFEMGSHVVGSWPRWGQVSPHKGLPVLVSCMTQLQQFNELLVPQSGISA